MWITSQSQLQLQTWNTTTYNLYTKTVFKNTLWDPNFLHLYINHSFLRLKFVYVKVTKYLYWINSSCKRFDCGTGTPQQHRTEGCRKSPQRLNISAHSLIFLLATLVAVSFSTAVQRKNTLQRFHVYKPIVQFSLPGLRICPNIIKAWGSQDCSFHVAISWQWQGGTRRKVITTYWV